MTDEGGGPEYPAAWGALPNPYFRLELIEELKDLSDPVYPWRAWVERSVDRHLVTGIDQTFHFFFDDHDFARPEDEIGVTLLDAAEADAIRPIVELLDRMLADLGDADSEAFLRHPLWARIAPAASAALALLAAKGMPVFTPVDS